MAKKKEGDLISNRRALRDYEILETFEAGLVLVGSEIKSLREHKGSLQDSYIIISNGEAFIKNCSIPPYSHTGTFSHEEKRERKILLHKRELAKLRKGSDEKGLTIIALGIYLKKGYAKVKVALARGKKSYDKRHALKEKEHNLSMQRAFKKDNQD